MSTKVLLVYPIPSISSPQKSPPLSILHVGRALSEAVKRGMSDEHYHVRYFDERYDDPPDMDWPDVVGVSSMTGYQLKGAIRWLKEAKSHKKRTILGGIHVTMQPEQCLREPYVDSIVLSEGEWAILDAIHGSERAVRPLNGEHVSPVSPETLIHFQRSARTGDTVLMTSRGCPFRCGFCLDGDTLVMMSDLTWKPLRDVSSGDKIVGLEKTSYGHTIVASTVLATSKRIAKVYKITTDRGSVIATAEHPWLTHANHSRWRTTDNLKPGNKIRWVTSVTQGIVNGDDYKRGYLSGAILGDGYIGHYYYIGTPHQHHFGLVGDDEMLDTFKEYANDLSIKVTEGKFNGGDLYPNTTRIVRTHTQATVSYLEELVNLNNPSIEYKRGFLAGFYDADGSCDRNVLRFWNFSGELRSRVSSYLSELGFDVAYDTKKDVCTGIRILGGSSEKLRFFSLVNPKVKHKSPVFGIGLGNECATVISVIDLDERDVYDIQTTTENFVANGLVSHNCYIQEFFERRWESVDLDRWKWDVLYLKENAGVVKYEHGDDWIGKWSRAREIIKFLWDNGIEYRPSIRAHQINDEVAREMAEMGIKHISVGMETASDRMLKLTQKDITTEDQIVCAEALSKHGIWPLYYWIVGFPTETQAEVNETLDQADRLYKIHNGKLTQNFYAYTALPGSPMFELVDQSTLPQSMEEWSNYSLNQTYNKQASNLYHIGGLYFHRGPGDKTDRNFPGWRRMTIKPFETMASWRWRHRKFGSFGFEKLAIEFLLKGASKRHERLVGTKVKDADVMDWGVRENAPGEYMTGEIGRDK